MNKSYEENYLIKNMGYGGINPVICGQEKCVSSHSFGPASRDYYLLHYVVSGEGEFVTEAETYFIKATDCFLIKPHELTTYIADNSNPWHYIWVGFECDIDTALIEKRVISSKRIANIFRKIPDVSHMQSGREAYLCSKIWEMISIMSMNEESSARRAEEYVSQAISCIETEYMMDISVAKIAQRIGLDRSYFSTLFKKSTGVSPQKYLSEFRLSKAAELLKNYGYTVTQAAMSTGYSDVFSFSKMFKRRFGLSPTNYVNGDIELDRTSLK